MRTPSGELTQFLRSAKAATYAAQGDEASVAPLLPDSKQLEFRDGALLYRDIYVGMFRFVGQEIVYSSGQAVWSMSYAGGLVGSVPQGSAKLIYAFLRKALLSAPTEMPLRGPATLQGDGMHYSCQTEGALEWFHGVETIAQNGVALYELHFNGGSLS